MSMRIFHPTHRPEFMERAVTKALQSGQVTYDDVALIRQYLAEKKAVRALSFAREIKILYTLLGWRRYLTVPFRALTIDVVYNGIERMRQGKDGRKGGAFKHNTVRDYLIVIKPFLLWLIENEDSTLPATKVRKITAPGTDNDTSRPEDLLTTDEVADLIRGAHSSRDRAIIATLYESGCRVGELAALRWRDVIFDEWGVKLYISDSKSANAGMAGKTRYARLITARQYLATWKGDHPSPTPADHVFLTVRGEPVLYQTIAVAIRRAATRGKVNKRVNPHIFRKSRITHMIAAGYQESVIRESMWGNLNTQMFKTYVKLREKDIDAEYLERAGVRGKDQEVARPFAPIPCSRCGALNSPAASYCSECALPLTKEAYATQDAIRRMVASRPDIVIEYLKEMSEAKQ